MTIKEFVVLSQESQSKRIDEQERLQNRQDAAIEKQNIVIEKMDETIGKLTESQVATKGKTDFAYKVIICSAGVLIVGTVGTIFTLIWTNATRIKEIEKVTSCLTYLLS